MKLTGRPTLEMQAKHEAYVLDIAFKEFLSHGFKGTSLDAIARRAKISRATLYKRHHGKEGLFLDVSRYAVERLHFDLHSVKTNGRPPAVLEEFLMRAYEAATQPEIIAIVRMAVAEQRNFPTLALTISRRRTDFLQPMTDYVEQLEKENILRLNESPKDAVGHLMELCLETYNLLLEGNVKSPRQRRKDIKNKVGFFLRGSNYSG